MPGRRDIGSLIVGLILGLMIGSFMLNYGTISRRSTNLRNNWAPRSKDVYITSSNVREEKITESFRKREKSTSLVFVGVMTANKFLGTRAKAIYETWGQNLAGKMAFFSSESSTIPKNCPELPLVSLPRVDDSYPPQKKSFLMLQYMWNNYGDSYEWFLRADDDVYVRTDKLEKFLLSVDSRKPMYIGQCGRGNNKEFGLLSLEYDENYCMGGPGVIMSRETLRRIVPHIGYCLKNLYTTHEDIEIGRCVQKFAGIPCTWNYEMKSILYNNMSGDQAFTGNLKSKEVHQAITLHPIKSPPHMYRLHNYIRGLKIQDLQQERVRILRDVSAIARELRTSVSEFIKSPLAKDVDIFSNITGFENYSGDTEVLGVPAGLRSFEPRNSREVENWNFYAKSEYTLVDSNPCRSIHSNVKEGLEDIRSEVMISVNSHPQQRATIDEKRPASYGYRRVDAYGADTILDLGLVYKEYRGRKVRLSPRRHVYLHQHFTGLEIREVHDCAEIDQRVRRRNSKKSRSAIFLPDILHLNRQQSSYSDNDKMIKFVLPLSGRYQMLERFLNNYEEICLLKRQQTKLVIVLYRCNSEVSYNGTLWLIDKMRYKYGNEIISVLKRDGHFSRAKALDHAVLRSTHDEILFFVDVDIVFTSSALNRIRLNTVINKRVYFPVIFSQFDPKNIYSETRKRENFVIDEKTGYWRQFGFGVVSIYKVDYRKIGGFDLSIDGWGKEDVDLYEKALKSELDVFRSPDKNLIHVYHEVGCDARLIDTQNTMCHGTKENTYGSTETLAKMIDKNPDYLRFAKLRKLKSAIPDG